MDYVTVGGMGHLEWVVVYDVEIAERVEDVPGVWDNPEGMGFSCGVAYFYAFGYKVYVGEDGKRDMISDMDGLLAVTFNGIKFDSRVLLGNERGVTRGPQGFVRTMADPEDNPDGMGYWDNLDLLVEYVKSRWGVSTVKEVEEVLGNREVHDGTFNLDAICKATLGGMGKSGHGARAPLLWQEFSRRHDLNALGELISYNLQDVRLTKRLFEFALEHGYVVDGSGHKVTVGFPPGVSGYKVGV